MSNVGGYPEFPQIMIDGYIGGTQMTFDSLRGANLEVIIMLEENAKEPSAKQLEALNYYNSLSPDKLNKEIATAARSYYRVIDNSVNLSEEGVEIDESHIEKYYRYTSATIPQHKSCDLNFILLHTECAWEEEHGMHILLADGHVVYCGDETALHVGPTWKQIISAETRESCVKQLKEYIDEN